MVQFSSPGVQKEYKGSDYRGTAGLHSKESGGIASAVVVYSELERQQAAFNLAVTQLEASFRAADTSDTEAWQAATGNISRQLNNLAQGIANRMAVAARWEGSLASLQAAITIAGTTASIPQTSGPVSIATINADFATNEDYNTQIKAKSWEHLVLVHNTVDAADTGIYCVSGGTLQKFSPFFGQLRDSALIFVDQGDKANSFWTIADPTIVTANNVVIPSLIPFGAVTSLQTDPNGFLTIAANQLNAALDGAYFVVSNGTLTMTPAFVARVTGLETGLSAAQSSIVSLQSGLQTEVVARQLSDATMQLAIDGKASSAELQSEITARTAADTAINTALNSKASQTALDSEAATRLANDESLATSIATKASQSALTTEIADRTSADLALQTAIDSKASQTDLNSEVAARTALTTQLQTEVSSKASQVALDAEIAARTDADAQLAIDVAARTTAQQLHEAIANFTAYSNPVKGLTGGIFNTTSIVPTTTFYVPLADTLDWGVTRYSESAAPFINVQMPNVAYVNTDAAGTTGYFLKMEFQHDTQIPDNEIEVYLARHYRAGQTGIGFFLATTTAGGNP